MVDRESRGMRTINRFDQYFMHLCNFDAPFIPRHDQLSWAKPVSSCNGVDVLVHVKFGLFQGIKFIHHLLHPCSRREERYTLGNAVPYKGSVCTSPWRN